MAPTARSSSPLPTEAAAILLIDGQQADSGVPPDDRGFAYGHGVFETLLLRAGRWANLDRHLARLLRGCRALGIQLPPDADSLLAMDLAAGAAHGDGVGRLVVTAGSGPRGYRQTSPAWRRVLTVAGLPDAMAARRAGISLHLCHHRLPQQPALAGIKHLNRLDQVLAAAELPDGIDEGLLLDQQDRPVCATSANLWLLSGQRLLTPQVSAAGVAGTVRAWLLDAAREPGTRAELLALGINGVVEADLSLPQLGRADGLFLSSSLLGMAPVQAFSGGPWQVPPPPAELAAGLQQLLQHHHVI